ncbi:hypothetical protein [Nannocystis exedens]|uniref:hypothetical protein n=1 Tax=Nannocystis exedens TaxID=54 RepID=UPI000BC6EEE4|nr:hypothetical protein [Nannocystis exedens]PCC68945.1 hypothetical protein NAEX_01966 [Nannocystis exedens]
MRPQREARGPRSRRCGWGRRRAALDEQEAVDEVGRIAVRLAQADEFADLAQLEDTESLEEAAELIVAGGAEEVDELAPLALRGLGDLEDAGELDQARRLQGREDHFVA